MADSGTRAAADEPRSPWLRTGFVLAAAFIGFVTVIGGAVVATSDASGEDDRSTASQPPPDRVAAAPSSRSPGGDDGDDACPQLADERQDVPTAAPRGVTWDLYGAVALPSSKAAGPAVAGEDVARCYARTPVGALLATSQISVRYLAADDWRKVTLTQTVGAGRDAYIAERTKAEESASADRDGGAHGQIAGFKFVTYNDTTAVIQTVWRFPDGRMQAATTTVLWRGGDWRLEYPAAPAAATPLDSLAGYAEWGGV
ncbi:hypothetical protein AB0M05_43935 [Streptomyces violaceusniger]|uniref:hypothetical protein n=1 Tax=Streptomyces violaceusniger TaxID=68280 RepID=UPI003420C643